MKDTSNIVLTEAKTGYEFLKGLWTRDERHNGLHSTYYEVSLVDMDTSTIESLLAKRQRCPMWRTCDCQGCPMWTELWYSRKGTATMPVIKDLRDELEFRKAHPAKLETLSGKTYYVSEEELAHYNTL